METDLQKCPLDLTGRPNLRGEVRFKKCTQKWVKINMVVRRMRSGARIPESPLPRGMIKDRSCFYLP
jgi:hypothetical protein